MRKHTGVICRLAAGRKQVDLGELTPHELGELAASTSRKLEHLGILASTRRVRRADPTLGDAVERWAAEMAPVVRDATPRPMTIKTFTTRPFFEFFQAIKPILDALSDGSLVGQVLALLADPAAAFTALLARVMLAASNVRVAPLAIDRPVGTDQVPRPPVGPRVPHGPPSTRLGPRLSAA